MEKYQYMIRCTYASNTHAIFEVKIYDVKNQADLNFSPCIYEENVVYRWDGMLRERASRSLGDINRVPRSMIKKLETELSNLADFVLRAG